MTLLDDPPAPAPSPPPEPRPQRAAAAQAAVTAAGPPSPQRLRRLFAVWLVALLAGLALVIYGFGPTFHDREQRSMLRSYALLVDQAANAGSGLIAEDGIARAPQPGASVGILEVGDLQLQEVVVEGVGPAQTRKGPGHVPGTAGLGQPGNSVLVGRRTGFGGPFGSIGSLDEDDRIVVTTTQGQAVYVVASVEERRIVPTLPKDPGDDDALADEVYGPSEGDQLTLITSAARAPWNDDRATVVVATMDGDPFPPTPQNGRGADDTGARPDGGARAPAVLAIVAYGLAMGLSLVMYKRLPPRVAYLLTAAPIVALTIIAGETFSRLLPAWL